MSEMISIKIAVQVCPAFSLAIFSYVMTTSSVGTEVSISLREYLKTFSTKSCIQDGCVSL